MNICFVASSLGIGGLERVVTLVGEQLNEKQNSVYYYSIDNKKPYWKIADSGRLYLQADQLTKSGRLLMRLSKSIEYIIKFGHLDINHYQKKFIQNVVAYIRDKKIDVLVLTSAYQIAAIPIIKEQCKKLKIISWIHQSHQAIAKNSKKFEYVFLEGIRLSDKVVCLTDTTTNYFSRANHNTMKIYNPISINGYNQVSKLCSPNISFVSRISFRDGEKGLDLLINIAKKLPKNIYVTVAGSGDKVDEKKFSQLIMKNNLQKKIIWQGSKQDKSLVQHYVNSSLFISTSRTEGFSLVILEAMSLGLPIISSPTTGSQELLRDGRYGIITEMNDASHVIKIIEELMKSPFKLAEMQKASLERATDFNKYKIISQWIEMIKTL